MTDKNLPQLQTLSLAESDSHSPASDTGTTPLTPSSSADASTQTLEDASIPVELLKLPLEVLGIICKHIFAHYMDDLASYNVETGKYSVEKLRVASPRYDLGDRLNNPEGDYRMPWYTSLSASYPHLGLSRGTLNILTVCTRLYEVGAPALYGLCKFRTTSAESFRLLFTKHIGPTNLKAIRKLTIGLPHGVKTMPSKYLGRYTRMLDNQMPQLQEFTITTKFGRWYYPVTLQPGNTWVENHRGMLWFAAWVTRSHPLLKCAVWHEKNTVYENKLDDNTWAKFDDRPDAEISVTISSVKPVDIHTMRKPQVIEARNARLLELYGEPQPNDDGILNYDGFDPKTGLHLDVEIIQPATRILLDSWKIRRKGFVGLSSRDNCRPYAYQLSPSAKDSESSKPSENRMKKQEFIEEIFLHNKTPEATIANLAECKVNAHILRLRAKVLEDKNIEEEMFMKRGEPPAEPSDHGDEDNEDDDHGPNDNDSHGDPGHSSGSDDDDGDDDYNDGDNGSGEYNSDYLDGYSGGDDSDYDDDLDGYTSHDDSDYGDQDDETASEGVCQAKPGARIDGEKEVAGGKGPNAINPADASDPGAGCNVGSDTSATVEPVSSSTSEVQFGNTEHVD